MLPNPFAAALQRGDELLQGFYGVRCKDGRCSSMEEGRRRSMKIRASRVGIEELISKIASLNNAFNFWEDLQRAASVIETTSLLTCRIRQPL